MRKETLSDSAIDFTLKAIWKVQINFIFRGETKDKFSTDIVNNRLENRKTLSMAGN